MDELKRLADDYEWFLQAVALGVLRRKLDAGDREAAFQPRGQYLFEVEPGSGEWLQIGNEYAIRSNGLPSYYREQVIAAVRRRLAAMGPHQLALLAALMRHYQLRVYEPKLEVDETGAQLPSPSLPNITARRLYDAWLRRAVALDPTLSPVQVEAALAQLDAWSETGAGFRRRRLPVGGRAQRRQARDQAGIPGQRCARGAGGGAARGACGRRGGDARSGGGVLDAL
jgi:hypothetical protein